MEIVLRVFFTVAFFAWIGGFVFYKIKKAERGHDKLLDEYMEKERASNHARKHDIDSDLFFTADLSLLPAAPEEDKDYKNVLHHAERTMIRFKDRKTNVELKTAYGPSQIESIAAYEENFNEYIRALLTWAESLKENGRNTDALRILEYTLKLGSEFRRSYKLTADIYKEGNDYESLAGLLEKAEAFPFGDEGTKRNIIKYIMDLK